MEYVWIKEETLTAIGDAVRAKTGTSGMLSVEAMAEALGNIKGSGKYLFSKKETESGDVIGYAVSDDLEKYPDGGMQNGYYWEIIGLIKFTIEGTTYYAVKDMTLSDWCDSDYNTGGYFISDGYMIDSDGYIYGSSTYIITDGNALIGSGGGGSN